MTSVDLFYFFVRVAYCCKICDTTTSTTTTSTTTTTLVVVDATAASAVPISTNYY